MVSVGREDAEKNLKAKALNTSIFDDGEDGEIVQQINKDNLDFGYPRFLVKKRSTSSASSIHSDDESNPATRRKISPTQPIIPESPEINQQRQLSANQMTSQNYQDQILMQPPLIQQPIQSKEVVVIHHANELHHNHPHHLQPQPQTLQHSASQQQHKTGVAAQRPSKLRGGPSFPVEIQPTANFSIPASPILQPHSTISFPEHQSVHSSTQSTVYRPMIPVSSVVVPPLSPVVELAMVRGDNNSSTQAASVLQSESLLTRAKLESGPLPPQQPPQQPQQDTVVAQRISLGIKEARRKSREQSATFRTPSGKLKPDVNSFDSEDENLESERRDKVLIVNQTRQVGRARPPRQTPLEFIQKEDLGRDDKEVMPAPMGSEDDQVTEKKFSEGNDGGSVMTIEAKKEVPKPKQKSTIKEEQPDSFLDQLDNMGTPQPVLRKPRLDTTVDKLDRSRTRKFEQSDINNQSVLEGADNKSNVELMCDVVGGYYSNMNASIRRTLLSAGSNIDRQRELQILRLDLTKNGVLEDEPSIVHIDNEIQKLDKQNLFNLLLLGAVILVLIVLLLRR